MKKLFFLIAAAVLVVPVIISADEPGKDWDLYGSARMSGFYWDRSAGYHDSSYLIDATNLKHVYVEDPFKLTRTIWDLEPMSRFGAKIKKDHYGFRFELGWSQTIREVNINTQAVPMAVALKFRDGLVLRRLYGEWYINDFMTLLVGQEWCIANFFPSSQVFDFEDGLCYSGALYTGRRPMVKFTFGDQRNPALNWKTEFSLVKPDTFIIGVNTETDVTPEEKIPKIEGGATFEYKQGLVGIKTQLVAGINRYQMAVNLNNQTSSSHPRYLIRANCEAADIDLTVWKCRFSFAYAQGTNLAAYGVTMGNPLGSRADPTIEIFFPYSGTMKGDTTGTVSLKYPIRNTFTQEGCTVFNFKPLNFFALEVGAGKVLNHPDADDMKNQVGLMRQIRWAWYVNLQFTVLDGHLILIPEYSFSDLGEGSGSGFSDGGKWRAYGFLLQLDM